MFFKPHFMRQQTMMIKILVKQNTFELHQYFFINHISKLKQFKTKISN